jgi:hypothetical protein
MDTRKRVDFREAVYPRSSRMATPPTGNNIGLPSCRAEIVNSKTLITRAQLVVAAKTFNSAFQLLVLGSVLGGAPSGTTGSAYGFAIQQRPYRSESE